MATATAGKGQKAPLPLTSQDQRARRFIVGGLITFVTTTVLMLYLLPFSYMAMTSLKNPQQIFRNTILPLTQLTYTYEGEALPGYRVETGKEYPVFLVPVGEQTKTLTLIQPATETLPNIFFDPISQSFVQWEGDATTLQPAPQIALFTATNIMVNPEYGVENSKRYPLYEMEKDGAIEKWALIRTPESIFIDVNNPNAGVIKWAGDVSSLVRAQQISMYKYKGGNDPANGLITFQTYPLYEVQVAEGKTELWALVQGTKHIFVDQAAPDSGAFEWEGDLDTLTNTNSAYTYVGASHPEQGLLSNTNYPVYTTAEGNSWLLIRAGTGTSESLFINTTANEALVETVMDDRFSPVLEDAVLLYQGKFNEREFGLVTLGNYPVYLVNTDEGEQKWALVRQSTGTDESFFVNTSNLTFTSAATDVQFIKQVVDVSTLKPVFELNSKYRHNAAALPRWSVQAGDKLLRFKAPESGRGEEWALVSAGTPGKSATFFISPSEPEKGVFEYSDTWVGAMDTIDKVDPQWGNFETSWNRIKFPRLLFNTVAIAFVGIIGTLISCTLVAYGFARFPIPHKNLIFLVLIGTIILPRQVTLIPTYILFSKIGWTNTWLPLIVPHFFANAYNVFLLRQFFQTIPREIDEAAMIDGAGPFRTLISVILPQAYPALIVAGLFHMVFAWNDYFEPLIYLLARPELQPISVGVQQFNFVFGQEPHLIQATSIMALLLPLLLFFFLQRFFMRGIVITGIEK